MLAPPRTRRSLLKPLLILSTLAIVAGVGTRLFIRRESQELAPVGYLLAVDGSSKASTGWMTHPVTSVLPVQAGKIIKIPAGAKFRLVQSQGRIEPLIGPKTVRLMPSPAPDELDFFRSPFREILAQLKNISPASAAPILVTSPVGVTRFLNPSIDWKTRGNIRYDVAVRDPSDGMIPVRIAQNVLPPVELAHLETPQNRRLIPDRIYEVVVRETESKTAVGGAHFLTRADADTSPLPTDPCELLAEAVSAMAKKPTRTGDAWSALAHLPERWAQSELALRLRLQVAVELGLADEIAVAMDEIKNRHPEKYPQ